MTYRSILTMLSEATQEELDQDAMVYLCGDDEFVPIVDLFHSGKDDVLDAGHLYLTVTD